MSRLTLLRQQLASLLRRRGRVRRLTALCALALAVVWALAAMFVVDVLFSMSISQRLVALVIAGAILVWAVRRYVQPWLGQQETELDMALLVERNQRIDTNDVVAALQFESPDASSWGSTQLQSAVIEFVGEFSRGCNVFEGFSRRPLICRAAILGATLLLVGLLTALFPDYARVFFNRLALGSQHYPTNVKIQRVEINGIADATKCAYGQPLHFKLYVVNRGREPLPAEGRIEMRELKSDARSRPLELRQQSAEDRSTDKTGEVIYVGELASLLEGVRYQAFIGDDWTEATRLDVIPLPNIELKLSATPPEYARHAPREDEAPGSRQISVLEGSRVDVQIRSDKPLKLARLKIGDETFALKPSIAAAQVWQLPDDPATPLTRVLSPLNYAIEVVDEDQLTPEHPLQGSIRMKADHKPTVSADLVTQFVLPTALPKINYRANDDFGIAKMVLHVQVVKQGSEAAEPKDVLVSDRPALGDQLPLRGSYPLELQAFRLAKGDQVRLRLEVWDYRGAADGESTESDPLLLNVTDESGIVAAISESDERSARQLDAIIKRQLETGGTK